MTTFADLAKPVKDFFSKGYNNASVRFEGKAKTTEGLVLSPTAEQTADGKISTTMEFEQTFPLLAYCDTTAKINLSSAGRMKTEAKLKNIKAVKGLTSTVAADMGMLTADKDSYNVSGEYKASGLAVTANAKFPPSGASLEADTSVAYEASNAFLVGASAKFAKGNLSGWEVGLRYKKAEVTALAIVDQSQAARVGGLYSANDNFTLGAEVNYGKELTVTAGTQTKVNGTTFRAKVNNTGKVGVSAEHKVTPCLTATISAELDTAKHSVGKVGAKFVWEN